MAKKTNSNKGVNSLEISNYNSPNTQLTEVKSLLERKGQSLSKTIQNRDELILGKSGLHADNEYVKPQPTKQPSFQGVFREDFLNYEISQQELKEIYDALNGIVQNNNGSYYGFDAKVLVITQTNYELKKFTDEIIPEKYHEKMYEAIDYYSSNELDKYVRLIKSFNEGLINQSAYVPEPTSTKWRESGIDNVTKLGNGTHRIFEANSLYMNLFNKLREVDDQQVNEEYENILKTYYNEEKRTTKVWLSSSESRVKSMQNQMRQSWNKFVQIKEGFSYPTEKNNDLEWLSLQSKIKKLESKLLK